MDPVDDRREEARLQSLRDHGVLDTPTERSFDDLTELATQICGVPISAISLVDRQRQWFKSITGLDARETPRDMAFCAHAIQGDRMFLVEDAAADPRFRDNPLVTGEPGIRFYAGMPLRSAEGHALGALCVIDRRPRKLEAAQLRALEALARQTCAQLSLKRRNLELQRLLAHSREDAGLIELASVRLRALLGSIRSGIFAVESDGRGSFLNPPFARMFGLPVTEAGQALPTAEEAWDLIANSCSNREQVRQSARAQIVSQAAAHNEELVLLNGRVIEVDGLPLLAEGAYRGHLWTFRDITSRRIAERTIADQRLRISEASKLAALGEMAGGLSHEINNPLAILMGRIGHLRELALEGALTADVATDYCDRMGAVVTRLSRIVAGLRSFARDGQGDPLVEESVLQIVSGTLEFCSEKIRFQGVVLRVAEIDPGSRLRCRSVQISQVLLNLMNNALDAVSGQADPWIELGFSESASTMELTVTDSGKGIPEEVARRIFDPFFTTKPVGKGTGLGLSISKGLVEAQGGRLVYERTLSGNTRFCMRFPLLSKPSEV